nr:hypothetical protein [Coxiella endosymbiont of Ornithodoros amblus]
MHRNPEQPDPQQIANTQWALTMTTVSWEYLQGFRPVIVESHFYQHRLPCFGIAGFCTPNKSTI